MIVADVRPRVATAKAVNLRQLADEVGAPLSAGEGEVVAVGDTTLGQLAAAIEAHTPDPNYGVAPEVLTLRALAAKSSLTATEVAQAVKLILRRVA